MGALQENGSKWQGQAERAFAQRKSAALLSEQFEAISEKETFNPGTKELIGHKK